MSASVLVTTLCVLLGILNTYVGIIYTFVPEHLVRFAQCEQNHEVGPVIRYEKKKSRHCQSLYVRSSDLSCIRLHVIHTTGQWGVRLWVKG
jgi:hypothetical protein